jgi:sigma-B regulation protein RsbU (phosphoserine phosphatase)
MAAEIHQLACLEIWGGNGRVERDVQLPGLAGWVYSKPYEGDERGGDVCYVSLCGAGQLARVSVADVSGHGQAVSRLAERLRDLMRTHINTFDQSDFVRELNKEFQLIGAGGKFATVVLLGYLRASGDLLFTNGGHPPPLRYHAGAKRWEYLVENRPADEDFLSNLPLGVIPGTDYRQIAVRLEPGDLVLVYSDAVLEAVNAAGEMLGEEGLLRLAQALPADAPAATGRALLEAVRRFCGCAQPKDDQTVVVLQRPADWCPIG